MLRLGLPLALASSALLAACQGCQTPKKAPVDPVVTDTSGPSPSLRLYLASTVAGALEPCGCSKNQLGGIDHLGALIASQAKHAPASLMAAAGPLFFPDPEMQSAQATQDRWKADTLAGALASLHFVGWAPGLNDWAAGPGALGELTSELKTTWLGANLTKEANPTTGGASTAMRTEGGIKVGFVGLSQPTKNGMGPAGVSVEAANAALKGALETLRKDGAQVLVGLLAMPRGEALRLVELTPGLTVAVVGKPFEQGVANDKPAPPTMIESTLVVQPANHLQSVAVVDLFVRGGSFTFADASAEAASAIPATGSFVRARNVNITGDLGRDDAIHQQMLAYYGKVNDHNKVAFADRAPPPPGPDGNWYLGVDACTTCHAEARKVWDKTAHAHAYKTLSDQHKEFNLDCVSCHVTGYEKPGGSAVVKNEGLRDVQCENCHGPGGRHRDNPADKSLIIAHPPPDSCVSSCHHPPHVDAFDAGMKMPLILGPGHGKPAK